MPSGQWQFETLPRPYYSYAYLFTSPNSEVVERMTFERCNKSRANWIARGPAAPPPPFSEDEHQNCTAKEKTAIAHRELQRSHSEATRPQRGNDEATTRPQRTYLPTYLPAHTYLPTYLPTHTPTYTHVPTYLLHTYIPTCSTLLPTLPTYLPTYLPIYLPTYLSCLPT